MIRSLNKQRLTQLLLIGGHARGSLQPGEHGYHVVLDGIFSERIVLVSLGKRPRNSVGTYGMIGVLAHPSRLLRQPSPAEGQADIAAVRRGEARRVACFLMGSFAPLPSRLRQGWLYLSSRDAQWKPLWSIRRRARQLNGPIESVKTRPADEREPLTIQGGKYGGIVVRPRFGVVTCRTASGWFYLAVPAPDVPLVVDHFSSTSRPAD